MSLPPLPMAYQGVGVWHVLPHGKAACEAAYGVGEVVLFERVEIRSEISHDHQFAWLKEAWETLPEEIAANYPTQEHLRKAALIAKGWCTIEDYACGSRTEALRWAGNLRRALDDYTLVSVSNTVVRVFRAKSQSRRAMNKADFQASKTAVIDFVAALLDVPAETLSSAANGAGGANNPVREAAA